MLKWFVFIGLFLLTLIIFSTLVEHPIAWLGLLIISLLAINLTSQ